MLGLTPTSAMAQLHCIFHVVTNFNWDAFKIYVQCHHYDISFIRRR